MNTNFAQKAYFKALKLGFEGELRKSNEKERPFTKAYLAQKLHDECHFDLALCNQTLDALCAELFGEAHDIKEGAPERMPKNSPRKKSNKVFIIIITGVFVLCIIAALVWYNSFRSKADTPLEPDSKTEQKKNA